MKLSAPIHVLKQQARAFSRKQQIPLHLALDRIARREGFRSWSLLSARSGSDQSARTLLSRLRPGDMLLLGSRPGQGKTLLGLDLAIESMKRGSQSAFFTLEFTRADVAGRIELLGAKLASFDGNFLIDDSDEINADYVIDRLGSAPPGTLVVIDYLQLLDQRRQNPDLTEQVQQLKGFARERELIIVCLSQIDRSYDPAERSVPDLSDVRLPNPLDLTLFDKACFLSRGRMQVAVLE